MTIARPVYAEKLPAPIPRLGKVSKALHVLYGPDCTMTQHGRFFVFFTPGDHCHCSNCADLMGAVITLAGGEWMDSLQHGMIVCPTCGNKRCPNATDHDYDCTGSNAPGQEGSVYQ